LVSSRFAACRVADESFWHQIHVFFLSSLFDGGRQVFSLPLLLFRRAFSLPSSSVVAFVPTFSSVSPSAACNHVMLAYPPRVFSRLLTFSLGFLPADFPRQLFSGAHTHICDARITLDPLLRLAISFLRSPSPPFFFFFFAGGVLPPFLVDPLPRVWG